MRKFFATEFNAKRQLNRLESLDERLRADVGFDICDMRTTLWRASKAQAGRSIASPDIRRTGAKAFAMPLVIAGFFRG